jgi:sialidase-1
LPSPPATKVPVVQASVLQLPGPGAPCCSSDRPCPPPGRRWHWRSDDGGLTFTRALTISDRRAAYSDLVRVDQQTVGVLYEAGAESPYETIEF